MEILVFLIGLAGGILGGYALHKWIWHLPRRRAKLPSDATNTDILSHEIRTPLALISGAAELLEDTSLDERQRRLLHTVTTNSAHAIRLAETFLTGAKIRGSGLRLDKEDVDLRELVRHAGSRNFSGRYFVNRSRRPALCIRGSAVTFTGDLEPDQ